MKCTINIEPGATRMQVIAAVQWLENGWVNTPEAELGEDDEFLVTIYGSGEARELSPAGTAYVFGVQDFGTFAYSEEFWLDRDEGGPPWLLYGSEDPENAVIELDFRNRNIEGEDT